LKGQLLSLSADDDLRRDGWAECQGLLVAMRGRTSSTSPEGSSSMNREGRQ
jgi:hypothetical protein